VAEPLLVPLAAVAQGDVDALLGVEVLLVGDVGDEFLVQAPPDVGEIDGVHGGASPQYIAMPPLTAAVVPVMKALSSGA
jgi:hypothetical protein